MNQTGDFHSADGTDPPGGSLLHWTYIPLSPSLLVSPYAALHSWEGPFCHDIFGLLPQGPPPFVLLVISFDDFQGAFLFMIIICWDLMNLTCFNEK